MIVRRVREIICKDHLRWGWRRLLDLGFVVSLG
jgi:hypothetical protein